MAAPEQKVRSHSCECLCESCERTGAGYFAQHQALAGNSAAARHLSPTMYAWLTTQRSEHLAAKRKAEPIPCAQNLMILFIVGLAWLLLFSGNGRGGHGRG